MAPKHSSIWLASIAAMALGLAGSQPSPAGVCCWMGGCFDSSDEATEADCIAVGGTWLAEYASCPTSGTCLCDEINDCNGSCAPTKWVGDGTCNDATYDWHGNGIDFNCAAFGLDGGDCGGGARECCDPPYSPGDRVRLLVADPGGATELPAGTCGTIVCCDYDYPEVPILVSWEGWTNGINFDSYCDSDVYPYLADSAWWMECSQVVADPSCGGTGVCCWMGACLDASDSVTESACNATGGTWFAEPASCPTSGTCLCDEINDCNGSCAPASWVGDGSCDDGTYDWHGNAIDFNCAASDWDGGDCAGTGTCCFPDGHCEVLTSAACTADGGTYQGDDTVCDPNPCAQPSGEGACFYADEHCEVLSRAACTADGGTYQADDTICDPNPCEPPAETGACCLANGICQTKTEARCTVAGGNYQGDDSSCSTTDCPQSACAYELTMAVEGEGAVSANPSHDTYDCDADVRLTATASECWHFAHWAGGLTGTTNPATLTMNGNKSITAVFEANRYTLAVTVEGEGRVSLDPAGGTYDCGTSVRLTATADSGWHFVRWAGAVSGTDLETSVAMSEDRQVTAVFEQDAAAPGRYTLTVTIQGEGSVDPAGGTYDAGTTVELAATPSSGWHFVHWTGDASGMHAGTSVVMSANRHVTAAFEADEAPPPPATGDDQSGAGLPESPPVQPRGPCPAAGAGIISLTLVGLLRSRRTARRRIPRDRV